MPIALAPSRQKKKPLSEICTEDATTTKKTGRDLLLGFFLLFVGIVCGRQDRVLEEDVQSHIKH